MNQKAKYQNRFHHKTYMHRVNNDKHTNSYLQKQLPTLFLRLHPFHYHLVHLFLLGNYLAYN